MQVSASVETSIGGLDCKAMQIYRLIWIEIYNNGSRVVYIQGHGKTPMVLSPHSEGYGNPSSFAQVSKTLPALPSNVVHLARIRNICQQIPQMTSSPCRTFIGVCQKGVLVLSFSQGHHDREHIHLPWLNDQHVSLAPSAPKSQ